MSRNGGKNGGGEGRGRGEGKDIGGVETLNQALTWLPKRKISSRHTHTTTNNERPFAKKEAEKQNGAGGHFVRKLMM